MASSYVLKRSPNSLALPVLLLAMVAATPAFAQTVEWTRRPGSVVAADECVVARAAALARQGASS